jgi:hypothetical protein
MRNRNTVEFLGMWESLNNAEFKPLEFEGFRNRAGLNSFVLTPRQWIDSTAAVGIVSKSGRYGGTFAHRDIAFERKRGTDLFIMALLVSGSDQSRLQKLKEKSANLNPGKNWDFPDYAAN